MSEKDILDELFEEISEHPVEEHPEEEHSVEEYPVEEEHPTEETPIEEHVEEELAESRPTEKREEATTSSVLAKELEVKEPEVKKKKHSFDLSPEKGQGKIVITIYGNKGEGKTGLALSFDGKISVISFDHKTLPVKELLYPDRDIIVYDGVRYYDESSDDAWLESSAKSLEYIYTLLEEQISKDEPDWIVLDGMETFYNMAEMAMRYYNNLRPYEGIQNRNIWKQRRMFMRQVHNLAMKYAKKGVIYTTYTTLKGRIVDAEGNLIDAKEVPRWYGVMEQETDVTIRVDTIDSDEGKTFIAIVENSKVPFFKTGDRKDVTFVGIKALLQPLHEPLKPIPAIAPLMPVARTPATQTPATQSPSAKMPAMQTPVPLTSPSTVQSKLPVSVKEQKPEVMPESKPTKEEIEESSDIFF